MSRFRMALAAVVLLLMASLPLRAAEQATVRVDASHVLRTMDHHMLLGTNVALWLGADTFSSPEVTGRMRALDPHLIRMPGGSWSDGTFWNGNGVRRPDGSVDLTRMKDGYPEIDYSAYAPTIVLTDKRTLQNWNGNVDVKTLHEYIQGLGAPALVTVNGGTGRAVDAAEWVRWADKMGYKVAYWEVGNELGGSWELGHVMTDGKTLTGPIFAERYEQFAQAMKKVDPSIKVGCMDWVQDVMGRCGQLVDFLTWHTYPLHLNQTRQEMLTVAVSDPARIAREFQDALSKGPAGSQGRIKLGVSEWNLGLEGNLGVDMFGAIWSSIFVGEMYRDGIDFATQWDAFTGGGGLIRGGDHAARMAEYWALYLWDHYMGDSLVQAGVDGNDALRAYATTSDGALYVMLMNTDEDNAIAATVDVSGFDPAAQGERALLSHRGYFWNGLAHRADWSSGPAVLPLDVGKSFEVEAPPMSISCIKVPAASRPGVSEQAIEAARKTAATPDLRILLPKTEFSDTPLEGWVRAYQAGTDEPYPVPLPAAKIEVTGPASADRSDARLAEAAGRFILRASAPGEVTVRASADGAEATATIEFKPSEPHPRVLWEFEQPTLGRGYTSSWKLSTDDSVRANQRVARIDLAGAINDGQGQSLLVISDFPPRGQLDRANIRGVFFDMEVSPDLKCEDPNAHIDVVMQSTGDYWMVLGSAPLNAARGKWVTESFPVTDPGHMRAMPYAFNVFLALRASKRVMGTVYIDKAGLLVR